MLSRFLRARMVLATSLLILSTTAMTGCKSGGGGNDTPSSGASATTSTPTNPTATGQSNSVPSISGAATGSVVVNAPYAFTPTASDADGDALSFQIQNKPSWATFSTVTGQLTGSPTAAATYSNIVISTSDGKTSASLPAFSITVAQASAGSGAATLAWIAPSQNVDGTALTDLAGFIITYGASSDAMTQTVRIENVSVDTYVFDQLAPGTYYFGIKAFTAGGNESDLSSVVSKKIG